MLFHVLYAICPFCAGTGVGSLGFSVVLLQGMCCVVGLSQLTEKIGDQRRTRTYGSHKHLHKRMLDLHPAYADFVSGAKCGKPTVFFCRVCQRDVRMKAQGAGEFKRHFASDGHWYRDVSYRVHMGLPVYNRLLEPMELTESQVAEFKLRAFVDLAEGFPFPEDLLPKHSQVGSKVPFMTFISCICEWLRSGGDFSLLRRLWANFRVSLGESAPEYQMNWSRTETVVSILLRFLFFVVFFFGYMVFWCVFWVYPYNYIPDGVCFRLQFARRLLRVCYGWF